MTDDLFEDFDLKSSADSKKFIEPELEKVEFREENSQDMHPDIFPGVEISQDTELSADEIRHLAAQIEEKGESTLQNFKAEPEIVFADTAEKVAEAENTENEVIVRTIDKVRRQDVAIDPEHFGATLRRLRESACLSNRDLSDELRIKESFLEALEKEDYDSLPPEVYIVAYIRRLGQVYHLTEDEIVLLSSKVRERMEVEIPEDMEKVVSIYEPSEENENKLRHIYMFFAAIVVIVILLVAIGVYFFVSGRAREDKSVPTVVPEEQFSSEMLIKLQPEVKLDAPALKITR